MNSTPKGGNKTDNGNRDEQRESNRMYKMYNGNSSSRWRRNAANEKKKVQNRTMDQERKNVEQMSTGAKCWGKLVPVLEYQVPNCTCFQMEWVLAHYAPAACILSSVVHIDFGSWDNGVLSQLS